MTKVKSKNASSKNLKKNLKQISKKMKRLDLCMMTTITAEGMAASRPMSNNGDVEYDGSSYFFASKKSTLAKDLGKNDQVNLAFAGPKKLFVSVEGQAKVVSDRSAMKKHWTKSLDKWFEGGIDDPDVVMIHVKAERIKYWQKEEAGEFVL